MTQEITLNWTVFGLTLAFLLTFGIGFAVLVRTMVKNHVNGQTAWMVVIGVAVGIVAFLPLFGLLIPAVYLAGFACAGGPMIYEYVTRVNDEEKSDIKNAKARAEELLRHDDTSADR